MSVELYMTSFEYKIAFHSAPTLLGIKPSSLIMLEDKWGDLPQKIQRFNGIAKKKNLHIKILCKCSVRALVLVYNNTLFEKQLEENIDMLKCFGYDSPCSENCLERLAERVSCNDFPHEIGIFLGYPKEDVQGFIEHGGENFKLCGYWKVYGDAQKARKTFSDYDKCREYLCSEISNGKSIYAALRIA